jgi:hypothetical protein
VNTITYVADIKQLPTSDVVVEAQKTQVALSSKVLVQRHLAKHKYRSLPKYWRIVVRTPDKKLLGEKRVTSKLALVWYLLTTSFDELANVEIYWTRRRERAQ